MSQEYIVSTQKISKTYGNYRALKYLSLDIPKGEIFGLLGPNGAGKTTFIRIINQITMPDTGKVFFDGTILKPGHIAEIGYLPEERGLYKNMKVGEQALYFAQLKGLSKKEAKKRLDFWFDRLEISSWWDKKLSELSKGMAQKVQFVTTVLHQPKLLIFDEPFSGFDPVNAEVIKNEILYLKEQGTSVIFSTHRMESVEEMCDKIALMNHGEIILEGKVKEIKNRFKNNEYQIIFKDFDRSKFEKFRNHVEILEAKEEGLELSLKVKQKTTTNLLSEASQIGTISTYAEILPTMNEVFINAVNKAKNG
ncbi:monosaccharide-transporting ATPase [Flavobacteriaceae bacterium UJ101]|nr:monosaccharide-transporting ATPase [Flavobacteriaceae bacterium UJ101]